LVLMMREKEESQTSFFFASQSVPIAD